MTKRCKNNSLILALLLNISFACFAFAEESIDPTVFDGLRGMLKAALAKPPSVGSPMISATLVRMEAAISNIKYAYPVSRDFIFDLDRKREDYLAEKDAAKKEKLKSELGAYGGFVSAVMHSAKDPTVLEKIAQTCDFNFYNAYRAIVVNSKVEFSQDIVSIGNADTKLDYTAVNATVQERFRSFNSIQNQVMSSNKNRIALYLDDKGYVAADTKENLYQFFDRLASVKVLSDEEFAKFQQAFEEVDKGKVWNQPEEAGFLYKVSDSEDKKHNIDLALRMVSGFCSRSENSAACGKFRANLGGLRRGNLSMVSPVLKADLKDEVSTFYQNLSDNVNRCGQLKKLLNDRESSNASVPVKVQSRVVK